MTVSLASSHYSTMLFDEMRGQLFVEKLYSSIWLKIVTGFSIQTESALF